MHCAASFDGNDGNYKTKFSSMNAFGTKYQHPVKRSPLLLSSIRYEDSLTERR